MFHFSFVNITNSNGQINRYQASLERSYWERLLEDLFIYDINKKSIDYLDDQNPNAQLALYANHIHNYF